MGQLVMWEGVPMGIRAVGQLTS